MKDKKHYYVVFSGLNELGVQEMNEYYKHNQRLYNIRVFKLNDKVTKRSKRFRLISQFGPESIVEIYDLKREDIDENGNKDVHPNDIHSNLSPELRELLDQYETKSYFDIQIKHMNHEVYEVNETYTLVK
jgi:hypothetical protein